MPCFKHIILTRDFKGAKVEAGRSKRSCYRGSGKRGWCFSLQWWWERCWERDLDIFLRWLWRWSEMRYEENLAQCLVHSSALTELLVLLSMSLSSSSAAAATRNTLIFCARKAHQATCVLFTSGYRGNWLLFYIYMIQNNKNICTYI